MKIEIKTTLAMLALVTLVVFVAMALFEDISAWDTFLAALLASVAIAHIVVFFFITMFGWPQVTRIHVEKK